MQTKPNKTGTVHILIPTGGKAENPFPLPAEAYDARFIEAAGEGDAGRASVRTYFQNVFIRFHGQWREVLQKHGTVQSQKCGRLQTAYKTIKELIFDSPTIVEQATVTNDLSKSSRNWSLFGLGLMTILMSLLTWVNIARFAAEETQDWGRAFLFAAPLLFVPFLLKYVHGKLTGPARMRVSYALTAFGVIAFLVFACSFTQRFGVDRIGEELAANPELLIVGDDKRVILLSQIILDPLLALAAFAWLREIIRTGATVTLDRKQLNKEAAEIENELHHEEERSGQYEGLLIQWEASQQVLIDWADAYWCDLQKVHQGLEAERRQRELEHQTILTKWQVTTTSPVHDNKIVKLK